jgi:ABC-type uncharacterized transport system auxiliary subunit
MSTCIARPFFTCLTRLLCGLVLGGFLAGCGNLLKQPAPSKQTFVLSTENPAQTTDAKAPRLTVQAVRIAPAYEARNFIYRLGFAEFESDYYNTWLVAPEELIQESLRAWLDDSGLVLVTEGGTMLDAQYVLETRVAELYGDYSSTDPQDWQAVLEMQFRLIPFKHGSDDYDVNAILLTETYRETEPLSGKAPDVYAAAQSVALQRVLERFQSDLRQAL